MPELCGLCSLEGRLSTCEFCAVRYCEDCAGDDEGECENCEENDDVWG